MCWHYATHSAETEIRNSNSSLLSFSASCHYKPTWSTSNRISFSVYGHEGVIKLVDWYECLDSFILIMERPENSIDLFDYIREKGKMNEQEAKIIFQQVLGAAQHIHSCGVVHRDIKDENIVLNRETGAVKIIDFGCGTLLKSAPYRDFSGTPEFYPPEWFKKRYYYARYSIPLSIIY